MPKFRRNRRYNPLPTLETKVSDALALIQKITENAEKSKGSKRHRNPYNLKWDESIADPQLEQAANFPVGTFSPLYIVARNLEPPVRKEVLRILLGDEAPFYDALIKDLEATTGATYKFEADDPVPPTWLAPKVRTRFGKEIQEPSELRKAYDDAKTGGIYKGDYEELENILRYKKPPVKRRRKR